RPAQSKFKRSTGKGGDRSQHTRQQVHVLNTPTGARSMKISRLQAIAILLAIVSVTIFGAGVSAAPPAQGGVVTGTIRLRGSVTPPKNVSRGDAQTGPNVVELPQLREEDEGRNEEAAARNKHTGPAPVNRQPARRSTAPESAAAKAQPHKVSSP